MILNVTDNKYPQDSFTSNNHHIFPLLKEIGDTYGDEFICDNWEALNNHEQVELPLNSTHTVSIQIIK